MFAFHLNFVDPLDPFVRRGRLPNRRDVRECQVIAEVRKEWGRADQGVVVVIVRELRQW